MAISTVFSCFLAGGALGPVIGAVLLHPLVVVNWTAY